MTSTSVADPLPCGRDGLAVVDRARADESTEHELSCPHCRARVAEDAAGRAARAALIADERAHPVPERLLPNVMRTVWSDLRRARLLPITSPGGPAFVARHVVVAAFETALAAIAELQLRTCAVELTGAAPSIRLAVAVRPGVRIGATAERARDVVRRTAATQFGWTVGPIDVEVVDLIDPTSPSAAVLAEAADAR